ncbi:MlaE family ABC transporter permease [Williamsia maris]|uniref:Phospholipid/cholesterol/gamma-HCH transport system permease protein n=1 Tax=Williamsia maris TaxID=72806 RepID=A0ABT1HC71_9NOCA|nr:ABC transporter permease [Williamsia maris]MCP2175517.1 phospholipid/cholesterol/gamma-HCH transport system permease protein [Williamsia maris]
MVLAASDQLTRTRRELRRASSAVDRVGAEMEFFVLAIRAIPTALRLYRKDVIRLMAEIGMGTGALAVIGGTVIIVSTLTLFTGGTIAIQGYSSLGNIGIESLTGFLAAFVNVRVAAPVIAGIGLAATIGAGATAQLGAMRISEEIDALETMGIRPIPFLISTRIIAGTIVIIPLYSMSVIASFFACRFATVIIYGQSGGLYDHYFSTFLQPVDLLWSFLQAIAMGLAVMLVHTFYGFTASGGPDGVGRAVGRAVRTSLIVVVSVTLLISLAVYGVTGNFHLSG